jgi:hypothetical protein
MSAKNVEIAKRVVDAFNRRDVEGFCALAVVTRRSFGFSSHSRSG